MQCEDRQNSIWSKWAEEEECTSDFIQQFLFLLSLMCHLAVKSCGKDRITFPIELSVIDSNSKSPVHTRGKEKTERVQVSRCHRHTCTHPFVSDTRTMYTYIMRLTSLFAANISSLSSWPSRNKLNHDRNLMQETLCFNIHVIQLVFSPLCYLKAR